MKKNRSFFPKTTIIILLVMGNAKTKISSYHTSHYGSVLTARKSRVIEFSAAIPELIRVCIVVLRRSGWFWGTHVSSNSF